MFGLFQLLLELLRLSDQLRPGGRAQGFEIEGPLVRIDGSGGTDYLCEEVERELVVPGSLELAMRLECPEAFLGCPDGIVAVPVEVDGDW